MSGYLSLMKSLINFARSSVNSSKLSMLHRSLLIGMKCYLSMLFEAGVLAICKGCIGNNGQKRYSSRVVAEVSRKP
jgi:hypothetical protein